MSETYTNNASTTLGAAITTTGATSITVASGAGFPSGPSFRILIDSEIMYVTTGGSGSTAWTVTRGAEGTTAATHANGASVYHVLTAGAIDQIRADHIQIGAQGSRPAAGKAGNVYYANDGPYGARDNGSSWDEFEAHPLFNPNQYTWSWVNQGTASVTNNGGLLSFKDPNPSNNASNSLRIYEKTPANSAPYTVIARLSVLPWCQNNYAGIGFRESSSGKFYIVGVEVDGSAGWALSLVNWASATSVNASITSVTCYGTPPEWFKLHYDGTNMTFFASRDGYTWLAVGGAIAKAAYFSSGPDQVIVGFEAKSNTGFDFVAGLYSWQETTP